MDQEQFKELIENKLPSIKNYGGISYVDGYIYALKEYKMISNEQFCDIRMNFYKDDKIEAAEDWASEQNTMFSQGYVLIDEVGKSYWVKK